MYFQPSRRPFIDNTCSRMNSSNVKMSYFNQPQSSNGQKTNRFSVADGPYLMRLNARVTYVWFCSQSAWLTTPCQKSSAILRSCGRQYSPLSGFNETLLETTSHRHTCQLQARARSETAVVCQSAHLLVHLDVTTAVPVWCLQRLLLSRVWLVMGLKLQPL